MVRYSADARCNTINAAYQFLLGCYFVFMGFSSVVNNAGLLHRFNIKTTLPCEQSAKAAPTANLNLIKGRSLRSLQCFILSLQMIDALMHFSRASCGLGTVST